MTQKVAILGASGFVGSATFNRLDANQNYAVTPFASSTGGATALAHQGRIFEQVDLLNPKQLQDALTGHDYIVNCSRGGAVVMQQGFDNLLAASRKCGIRKIVHISSVAIYGDPPHPDSSREDATTNPAPDSYGAVKLAQDDKLQKAVDDQFGAVILCPPNIIGPYSEYLIDIIESIERGRFRLLDEGQTPINVIDVDALAACIERAIDSSINDGRRLFVTHPELITWRNLCDELAPIVRSEEPIPTMTTEAFQHLDSSGSETSGQPGHGAFRHLISEEVREALKTHPRWAALERAGKGVVRTFGERAERYMRDVANGPVKVEQQSIPEPIDHGLVAQQLRRVRHLPSKCLADLDFTLPINFEESMQSFKQWYNNALESDSPEWKLLANRED